MHVDIDTAATVFVVRRPYRPRSSSERTDHVTTPLRDDPLPHGITVAELTEAIALNRSWRAVARHFGSHSAHLARRLRAAADVRGLDYSHFSATRFDDKTLVDVVTTATTWDEVLQRLGYAATSGTARATIRKHCRRLQIDFSHLALALPGEREVLSPQLELLRTAGPYLVAAVFVLLGCPVSFAPEGAAYDLVIDHPERGLERVQVKTTTRRSGRTWNCKLTRSEYRRGVVGGHGRASYCAEEVDAFACVDGAGGVYLIPIDIVEGKTSIHLRRYDAWRVPLRLTSTMLMRDGAWPSLDKASGWGPEDRGFKSLRPDHSPSSALALFSGLDGEVDGTSHEAVALS
jgi:hypothetical protein